MRIKLLITTFIISTFVYFSCQKELSFGKNDKEQFINAKAWFDKYLANNQIDPMFKNINYYWQSATTFTFSNGYKAITIPLMEKNQNPAYRGKRMLYLYPWKNGKGYYTQIFELIPDRIHLLKNKGEINLKTYSGLISSYDLKKGFVKGAQYGNGVGRNNITIELRQEQNGSLNVQSSTANSTITGLRIVSIDPGPISGSWLFSFQADGSTYGFVQPWTGANPYASYSEYTPPSETGDSGAYFDQATLNAIYASMLQQQQDQQWIDEDIKDSTNNPCATNTLNSLTTFSSLFPSIFRNIFGSSSDLNITFKSGNTGAGEGAHTTPNYTTNNFTTTLNTYYSNQTSLSQAATILHEMVHAQLMNWYRQAVTNNDLTTQQYLATEFHLYFDSASVAQYPDLRFTTLMNQNQGGQHQIMTLANIHAQIANALLVFAYHVDPNTTIDSAYCSDMAWAGTSDSKGFKALSQTEQDRLNEIIEGERGNDIVSPNYSQKGKLCQ